MSQHGYFFSCKSCSFAGGTPRHVLRDMEPDIPEKYGGDPSGPTYGPWLLVTRKNKNQSISDSPLRMEEGNFVHSQPPFTSSLHGCQEEFTSASSSISTTLGVFTSNSFATLTSKGIHSSSSPPVVSLLNNGGSQRCSNTTINNSTPTGISSAIPSHPRSSCLPHLDGDARGGSVG